MLCAMWHEELCVWAYTIACACTFVRVDVYDRAHVHVVVGVRKGTVRVHGCCSIECAYDLRVDA